MKTVFHFLVLLLLVFGYSPGQIISQYTETESGSVPKAIEIWNNTAGTMDFSISNLVIQQGTNGAAPSDLVTINSGTLASGACLVIGTTTPAELQSTTTSNGGSFSAYSFTFNGDDALVVKYGGVTTDVFGNPGSDPGTMWSGNSVNSANSNIQLKSGINTGDMDGWTDPSERFENVSATPSTDVTGFGASANTPLPVELVNFSAIVKRQRVELSWQTASERNNYGFEVERSYSRDEQSFNNVNKLWTTIGFTEGHGTTNTAQSYTYIDGNAWGKVQYRLKQIDRDGKSNYSKSVEVNLLDDDFQLMQNYPNPFNPSTTITFTARIQERVTMTLFNSIGQEITILFNEIARPNTRYSVHFNGQNIASGTYYYELKSPSFIKSKSMILLK